MQIRHHLSLSFALCIFLLAALPAGAQEICDNGIDDDGNGLVDLNDTLGCACTAILGNGGVSSLIPNASFEDYSCCPQSYSELNCADGWTQATPATSDYFQSGCPGGFFPSWITTPLPGGGTGCVGGYQTNGYQEYVGACLSGVLEAGTSYTLQFSMSAYLADNFALQTTIPINFGATDVVIMGSTSCGNWPTSIDCPLNDPLSGWEQIGVTNYEPSNDWSTVTITFTPTQDIQSIIIGGCNLDASYGYTSDPDQYYPYFLYDNLTLNQSIYFGTNITGSGLWYGNDAVLTGHADTSATGFQWYFEGVAIGGATDSVLQVSALGLDTGCYQLVTYLDTVCTTSEFCINPICVTPIITNAATSGCSPVAVNFQNGVDMTLVNEITWDFGDNSPNSNAANPSHSYTTPGVYNVTLSIESTDLCPTDTTYQALVTVYDFPEPDFTGDLLEGCVGMQTQFTNTTDTLTGSCSWNFGDGTPTNSNCDPLHTFDTAGLFDVTLTITSPNGCIADTTFTAFVNVYDFPDVSFTSDTIAGCTPLTIVYENTTPANQVGSLYWDLGVGDTTSIASPSATYEVPGTYTVKLHVTAPGGCEAELEQTDYITAYGHPAPTFTSDPDSGCYTLRVNFVNTTDPAFVGSCHWDFGDGSTLANCDPTHDYTVAGVYSVSLHVTSPQNCEGDSTYADAITVFDHPTAAFTFGPQPTDYFNTYITFYDSSSVDAIQWQWTFGENGVLGTSAVESPSLHFPSEDLGTYPVELVVTNSNTCTDTARSIVVIDGYFSVYAPNAFTPDGDGVNEAFLPMIMDQREKFYRLSIYDRWGGKVFESSHPTNPWIGTLMNTGGDPLPTGVYVWRLETSSAIDALSKEYLGHVTLLR